MTQNKLYLNNIKRSVKEKRLRRKPTPLVSVGPEGFREPNSLAEIGLVSQLDFWSNWLFRRSLLFSDLLPTRDLRSHTWCVTLGVFREANSVGLGHVGTSQLDKKSS
jgi:hypothetical protein